MSKENLDNLFQQKANNRSFEFKNEYWNEMELLLEEEDDKKRFIFWWWNSKFLLGSLLAVVAAGLLYWLLNSGSFNQNQPLSQLEHPYITQSEQEHEISSQKITNSVSNENASNTNSIDASSINNTNSSTNTLNSSTDTKTKQPDNQHSTRINSNQRSSRDKNNQPNNQLKTATNSNNSPRNTPQTNTSQKTDNKSQNTKDNPSSSDDEKGRGVRKTGSLSNSSPSGLVSNNSTDDASNAVNDKPSVANLRKVISSLAFIDIIDFAELVDTLAVNLPEIPDHLKPSKEKNKDSQEPKYPVTLAAEIGLNRYWHKLDAQNAMPYNFTGGIDFNIPIPLEVNNNLSLGLGLSYWSRGNINASLTEDSTVYSFGFQTISTTKSVDKSYFLEVPVSLSYRLAKKHQLMLGASYSYLLTAQGSTSTTISNDFEITSLPETTTFGFRNWLNNYDIAAQFGYKYFWNEKGYIGLEGKYGFRDLTPTTIYTNDIFDRNLQVRLLLGYNLFQLTGKQK